MKRNKAISNVMYFPRPGNIYLIHALGTGYFKIGSSEQPLLSRVATLQTGCPFRLRYVYHAYVEDMQRTEKELHKIFHSFREVGEWFSLTDASIKECITLMRLMQIEEPITSIKKPDLIKLDESVDGFCEVANEEIDNLVDNSLEIANEEIGEISGKASEFVWNIRLIKTYYPNQTPEALFLSIADAARSGKTIREIVRSVFKFTDGPDHPTRSYTQHGKTLLKWLVENFDEGDEIAALPEIQKLFQKSNNKE